MLVYSTLLPIMLHDTIPYYIMLCGFFVFHVMLYYAILYHIVV